MLTIAHESVFEVDAERLANKGTDLRQLLRARQVVSMNAGRYEMGNLGFGCSAKFAYHALNDPVCVRYAASKSVLKVSSLA
jgi:hypothetical protein